MPELNGLLTSENPVSLKKSPDEINERIERRIEANVGHFKQQDKTAIRNRIAELENEWDIEKMLMVNLSGVALTAAILSISANKKWAYAAGIMNVFLLQQIWKGWSLPFIYLRRMGIRTVDEINLEKNGLEALLEDFDKS